MTKLAEAVRTLTELLAIPDQREGAWEAPHVSALEDELRGVLALLQADEGELRLRLLDISEYAVDQLAGQQLTVEVDAPQGAIAWSANYGFIFQPYELRDAEDDGEVVLLVEQGVVDGVEGPAPLAGMLRADRAVQEFKQRVLSDPAHLRGEQKDR